MTLNNFEHFVFRNFLCLQCLSTRPQPMRSFTILNVRWELLPGVDSEPKEHGTRSQALQGPSTGTFSLRSCCNEDPH